MRRLRGGLLAAAVGAIGLAPALAGSWSFQPGGEFSERYDTNVALDATDASGAFITRFGAGLPLAWEGERSRFDLAYRFGYDAYVDNRELNNLSQYASLGWGLEDERNRGSVYASWGRTENPRLGATEEAEASPTPGADPGFQVVRTRTDYWLLSTGYGRSFSRAWGFSARLDGSAARYEDPALADNESYSLVLGADHRASVWNAWNLGLRYSLFDSQDFPTAVFSAVQGGATHQITRRLSASWLLGVVLKQDQAIRGDTVELGGVLSGTDRLYGDAGFAGEYRRSRWNVGYNREFTSGSGVRVAVRRDSFSAGAGWDVGRADGIGVSVSLARSRGVELDLDTRVLELNYSRPIAGGWSAQLAAQVVDQAADSDGGPGTYREEVYSVLFRYAGQRRT